MKGFKEILGNIPMIHLDNIYCLNCKWKTLVHLAIVSKKVLKICVNIFDDLLHKKVFTRKQYVFHESNFEERSNRKNSFKKLSYLCREGNYL